METNMHVKVLKQANGKWSATVDVVSDVGGKKFFYNHRYKDVRNKSDIYQLIKDLITVLSSRSEGGEN